jgi:uncharacterized protein (DUF2336 family)
LSDVIATRDAAARDPAPRDSAPRDSAFGGPPNGNAGDTAQHRRVLAELGEATRVRLGAALATSPPVLGELAADPAVTVRAAVAMNLAAPAHADRLLSTDADERVRTLLARKLAALIPSIQPRARSTLETQAYATLAALVEDEAVRVRAAIAEVVKDMPGAPRELILRLARDSALPVSEPVIRLSPLLTDEDLLALLAEAPKPEVVAAMARRSGLAPSVADVIAATADSAAIVALLENGTAAIRESTLDALVARATNEHAWHEPLVRRPTLSPRATRALAEIVTTQLLGVLASRGDLEPEVMRELQRRLTERLAPPLPVGVVQVGLSLDAALHEARALADNGELNEAALFAAAQRGEARLCTAMLAVAAGVSVPVVERAVTLRSAKGLVSLVWKAGFSMRVAAPLQVLLCRIGPDAVLQGLDRGSFPLAVDEMRWQLEFLQRVGR